MNGKYKATPEQVEAAKARAAALKTDLDGLANNLMVSPEEVDALVKGWDAGFHRYSLGNQLLIWWQSGGKATLCAGFTTWKRHGRYPVGKGTGYQILRPVIVKRRIPVKDPTGSDLPTGTVSTVDASGQTVPPTDPKAAYDVVTKCIGFAVTYTWDVSATAGKELDLGMNKAKGTTVADLEAFKASFPEWQWTERQGLSDGWTDGKTVNVAPRANALQQVAAAAHEVAHNLLGHLDPARRQGLERSRAELEAEATAYLVTRVLGIDNPQSKAYMVNWGGDKAKLEDSGVRVLKAAETILKRLGVVEAPAAEKEA